MMNTQMNVPPGMAMALNDQARLMAAQGQFTPVNKEGMPTIAAKNMAEISQREAAKQAGVAQQIEAMKMAQMQQAIRQMAAKQTSSPMASGIGGLPGDVAPQGMAEGGVVGYSGLDGSEVEVDETKLPVGERIKRGLRRLYEGIETDYMKRAGATPEQIAQKLGAAAPVPQPSTAVPDYTQDLGTPMPTSAKASPAPAPAPAGPRKTPTAATQRPAPSAPPEYMLDTRNIPMPSEGRDMYQETQRRIEELGARLGKTAPETSEQQAYRKAQEEQYNRGIAGIATQRQRYEEAEAARKAALKDQPMENLISRLVRVGGAGSLARGLGQAQLGMEPIIAGQRTAEQSAREKQIQYFDLLDQRRETVEGLKLSALKGDADRVAAETARLRAVDAEIAKLQIGLGEKRAGQLLTGEQAEKRTKMDIDARAKEAELNRANALKVEGIRAATREGAGDIAQKRLALQQLKADPEYTAAMNKIKELSKAAGLSSAPTVQAAFRTAQQEALAIAKRYGLTPQDIGAAGGDTGTAQRGTRENPIKLD